MLRAVRTALCLVLVPALLHCEDGATGIEACRAIEEKKCTLVAGCPGSAVQTDADIQACKLFYRDQCLHGIADSVEPDDASVAVCLAALDAAGACAEQTLSSCAGAPELAGGVDGSKTTGCEAVLASELLAGCGFLAPASGAEAGGATSASTAASGGEAGGGGAGGA